MVHSDIKYNKYLEVLCEELIPAMGCTEPIAIALAAAKARAVLGCIPQQIEAACSGNVIKNVKSVIVPGTGDMRGIETSAILGAVAGRPDLQLEVLSQITKEDVALSRVLLANGICSVKVLPGTASFHVIVTAWADGHSALVELHNTHTNVVRIEKDGKVLFAASKNCDDSNDMVKSRKFMCIEGIYDFANSVIIDDVSELIDKQIKYNSDIANEGLRNCYGACVGCTLLQSGDKSIKNRAKAFAAAGSDARMGGCMMPVIINSGSGNQGLAASLPVIEYAKHLHCSHEKLIRALVMSNLTAIHQKTSIGRLSAYCGAVSAACGAGAGIAYLKDTGLEIINQAVINTLGNVSGIVCDGAKSSCAAKIASSVDAALLALDMALVGRGFAAGEGIVKTTADDTVQSVGRMASLGMRETDVEILRIMVEQPAS